MSTVGMFSPMGVYDTCGGISCVWCGKFSTVGGYHLLLYEYREGYHEYCGGV